VYLPVQHGSLPAQYPSLWSLALSLGSPCRAEDIFAACCLHRTSARFREQILPECNVSPLRLSLQAQSVRNVSGISDILEQSHEIGCLHEGLHRDNHEVELNAAFEHRRVHHQCSHLPQPDSTCNSATPLCAGFSPTVDSSLQGCVGAIFIINCRGTGTGTTVTCHMNSSRISA
jgi:hypothetical protein